MSTENFRDNNIRRGEKLIIKNNFNYTYRVKKKRSFLFDCTDDHWIGSYIALFLDIPNQVIYDAMILNEDSSLFYFLGEDGG